MSDMVFDDVENDVLGTHLVTTINKSNTLHPSRKYAFLLFQNPNAITFRRHSTVKMTVNGTSIFSMMLFLTDNSVLGW